MLKEFIKLNVKMNMIMKNVKIEELNTNIGSSFLNTQTLKMIKHKSLFCSKNYQKKFDKNLKKRFFNTYKFSNNYINKFIFLLRIGVYLYDYMDDWEKFSKTLLPEKKFFYSHLNMENIADLNYTHTKTVCKDFEIR